MTDPLDDRDADDDRTPHHPALDHGVDDGVRSGSSVGARLTPGTRLPVASTKYDGSHHYRYEVTVVADRGDALWVWGPAGTVFDSYRGRLVSQKHFLWLHFRDRDYNVEVLWEADWSPRSHYVNVALPSTWDDGVLRFVDLDLDLTWRVDGTVRLLDEDEFAEHRHRWSYPDEIVRRSWDAVDEVMALIADRRSPFDGSLHTWRPPDHGG